MKPAWLEAAIKEIGVHEIPGPESNKRIVEYAACTTLHADSDEVAWCSSFVNWCMKQAGIKGTGLANARSWLTWGAKLEKPAEGCVVVLKRGLPPSGHVTLFAADNGDGTVKCLGGNQGDQVKYSNYPIADVLGYRWPV